MSIYNTNITRVIEKLADSLELAAGISLLSILLSIQITPCFAQKQIFVPSYTHAFVSPSMPAYQHSLVNNQKGSSTGQNHTWTSPVHTQLTNTSTHNGFTSRIWFNLTASSGAQSINLNLSSTNTTMTAGHLLQNGSTTINVGGTLLKVSPTTALTPAEYLAVKQVQSGGQQSLVLNSEGAAVGGSVVIGSHLSQELNSLVIPQGVTVIDMSRSGMLSLTGNVIDYGNLYVTSMNPNLSTITLGANNINVRAQGLISDVLALGSLSAWLSKADSNLDLNLVAQNNIVNNGTISSSGSLSLATGSGNITNTGLIASTNGSINVSTAQTTTNLGMNSAGGTYQALNGAINLRAPSYNGAANINLNGGNWLSQQFNINAGQGIVTGAVGLVSGTMNVDAGAAHIVANTPTLTLGNAQISGDPIFANTGNIIINGLLSPAEAIAIIAGGNITATSSGAIQTNDSNVTLIAGADITSGGGNGGQTIINSSPGVSGSVTMQFDHSAGGNIDFTASTAPVIISTNGGNVVLLANFNGAGTGNIWFPTTSNSINTANTSGTGGTVLIVAGGSGGTAYTGPTIQAIRTGNITTAAPSQTGGSVSIWAAPPTVTSGSNAVFNARGGTTATFGAGAVGATGLIFTNNINTTGTRGSGSVSATAGGGIVVDGNVTATSNTITLNAGGPITKINGTLAANSVSLTSRNSTSGIGTSASPINTAAANLTVKSNSNAYVSNVGNVTLAASYSGGNHTFSLITSDGGSINIVGNISGSIGTIILNAANAITDTSGILTANTINLTAMAGSINLGANVIANGINGGRIDLQAADGTIINKGVSVLANGTSGNGGMIEFSSVVPGAASVAVINNGTINASNGMPGTSGIVGFNGGPSGTVSLSGTGTVHAGQYVGFGNLNPVTLAVINFVIIPTTNSFSLGLINVTQGPVILNQIRATGLISPIPPITIIVIKPVLANPVISFFPSLRLLDLSSLQNSLQDEQIGTRVATDYTLLISPCCWAGSTPSLPGNWLYSEPMPHEPVQGYAYVERHIDVIGEATSTVSSFNTNELIALANNGIVFGPKSGNKFFDLIKGVVLFLPTQNIQVETCGGIVSIPKGAIVWIMETENDASIYDLHDNLFTGSIKVSVNKKDIALSPGTQILLTRNGDADFASLNPGNVMGYRNIRKCDLGDGVTAYLCNFSISRALTDVPIIHHLLASNDPVLRDQGHKLLKNAAILDDLTGYPEYSYGTFVAAKGLSL